MFKTAKIYIAILLAVCYFTTAQASTVNVKKLFAGNTAFGKKLKWGLSISVLFEHSGQLIVVDERGGTTRGKWWVGDDGKLCTELKESLVCRKVSLHDDGHYQVHNHLDDKQIDWTLSEISRGNPYEIK